MTEILDCLLFFFRFKLIQIVFLYIGLFACSTSHLKFVEIVNAATLVSFRLLRVTCFFLRNMNFLYSLIEMGVI